MGYSPAPVSTVRGPPAAIASNASAPSDKLPLSESGVWKRRNKVRKYTIDALRRLSGPRPIYFLLNPFTLKSNQFQIFPCSLTRNIITQSMKNLVFHSLLRWKIVILPILTTSYIHFLLRKVGRMYFLNLGVRGLSNLHVWSRSWSPLSVHSRKLRPISRECDWKSVFGDQTFHFSHQQAPNCTFL